MDRNSIIGFILIAALVIAYIIYNKQVADQHAEEQKHIQDSIAALQPEKVDTFENFNNIQKDTVKPVISEVNSDSVKQVLLEREFGPFINSAEGEEQFITIENENIIVTLSNKGGKVYTVEVKGYTSFDKKPLILFNPGNSSFGLGIPTGNQFIRTDSLYFQTDDRSFEVKGEEEKSITFRLSAGNGSYLEYKYSLAGESNLVDYSVKMVGFDQIIPARDSKFTINWEAILNGQERSLESERDYSTIYYQTSEDKDVDYIGESKNVTDHPLKFPLKWVSFKQQFFNSTLIADDNFLSGSLWTYANDSSSYLKDFKTKLYMPFSGKAEEQFDMQFYFGPSGYYNLKQYGEGLEGMVPMGGFGLGHINRYFILPVFDFFGRFTSNYGLIILLLAIFIKLILSPLTFKSFKSTAKMRVLKPELDELKEKYKDKPQDLQMQQMKLYRKTGVSMFGGCLPMLLQMPILIAMYRFFPATIYLRQAKFLWAEDLSTYDSIIEFTNFSIPFYGDHVSLFTILMALTSILYAKVNSQMTPTAGAGQMKMLQYIMPIFLVFIFNSFSSGLTYYYLLYNVLSFGQSALFKKFFINEDALRKQIEEKKKKPKKKSKWQQRMEDLQRSQEQQKRNRGRKK